MRYFFYLIIMVPIKKISDNSHFLNLCIFIIYEIFKLAKSEYLMEAVTVCLALSIIVCVCKMRYEYETVNRSFFSILNRSKAVLFFVAVMAVVWSLIVV